MPNKLGLFSHFNNRKGFDKLIAGYVRLSRDDDKKNYVSIENQKLIIAQYAKSRGMVINRWYEDDSVSGYKFDRPGFSKLMDDLENDIDTIISKDLSRIGRHNAKVLLLLDYMKEHGKRLLLVDDNYDTYEDNDDIIGIKTWYNERYVKDASKKIKRVLNARQKEGTLLIGVPFGYIRNSINKKRIEVVDSEADIVKLIYELYLKGLGYRKIANLLTEKEIPTPSMVLRERYIRECKVYKRTVTNQWSDNMIGSILKNDFYIGNLRLHKRERLIINGTDHRVSRENQLLFQENHEGIIDEKTFYLVQETMKKRANVNYRGQKHKFSVITDGITNGITNCMADDNKHIFAGYLYCKDCGKSLTPIIRSNKYYICNTYNSKGKQYCNFSHMIEEQTLITDILHYFSLCKFLLNSNISCYNLKEKKQDNRLIDKKRKILIDLINKNKNQLKIIVTQKIYDISKNQSSNTLILETYNSIQNEIMNKILEFEIQLNDLDKSIKNTENLKKTEGFSQEKTESLIQEKTEGFAQEKSESLTQEKTESLIQEKTESLIQEKTEDLTQKKTNTLSQENTGGLSQEKTEDLTQKKTNTFAQEETEGYTQGKTENNLQEKPLEILNRIITFRNITSKDIENLIEKIIIDKNGMPLIYLKYGLQDLFKNPQDFNISRSNRIETLLNQDHNEIILTIMKLIYDNNRTFISVKFLFAELNRLGFKISKRSIIPYILYMKNIRILQESGNTLKPYHVIIAREELLLRINRYIDAKSNGWLTMHYVTFAYIRHRKLSVF